MEVRNADPPDYRRAIPKGKGIQAKVVGALTMDGQSRLVITAEDGRSQMVNAGYVKMFQKLIAYDEIRLAIFDPRKEDRPVEFYKDGVLKAILMPMEAKEAGDLGRFTKQALSEEKQGEMFGKESQVFHEKIKQRDYQYFLDNVNLKDAFLRDGVVAQTDYHSIKKYLSGEGKLDIDISEHFNELSASSRDKLILHEVGHALQFTLTGDQKKLWEQTGLSNEDFATGFALYIKNLKPKKGIELSDNAKNAAKAKDWIQEILGEKAVAIPSGRASTGSTKEVRHPFSSQPEVYQGRGATPEQVYGKESVEQGRAVPLFGKANYYALTKEAATQFGKVTAHPMPKLKNPLVIDNDDIWFKLLQDADTPHLNNMSKAFYKNPAGIEPDTKKLQSYLKAQGYDSVVVKLSETSDDTKRMLNIFGDDQIIVFDRVVAKPSFTSTASGKAAPIATTTAKIQGEPASVEGKPVSGEKIGLFEDTRNIPIPDYETGAQTGLSKADAFKLSQATVDIYNAVNKSLGITSKLAEGNLPRRARGGRLLGVQYNPSHNIRTVGLGAVSTNNHELLHRIDRTLGLMERVIADTKPGGILRKQLTEIYVKYYPGGKVDHKLEKRLVEGYATLGEEHTVRPSVIERDYPLLVKEFLKPGGKYYHEVVGIAQGGFRKLVDDYQRLDSLAKFGSRITDQTTISEKNKFFNVWDRVKTEAFDNIWPLEKIDIEAKARVGVSLSARMFNNVNYIIYQNLKGDKGFWNLDQNMEFKKALDFNIGNLVAEVEKNGDVAQFGWWLIARRVMSDYKTSEKLGIQIGEAKTVLAGLMQAEAEFQIIFDALPKGEGLKIDAETATLMRELKTARSYRMLAEGAIRRMEAEKASVDKIIENDGWTKDEAVKAHSDYEKTFMEYSKKYDSLTKQNLLLMNNPHVQILDQERFDRYIQQEGYASMKREFYDEFVGEEEVKGIPRVAKNKVSALIGRHGSKRNVINPLLSLAKDHAEIIRKAMRQIVYNKLVQMAESGDFPELFEPEKLKPVPDRDGRMLFPQEKDPQIVMARKNYKRFPIRVDSELKRTLDETLNFQNMHTFEKLMQATSRFFSRSTTGLYLQFFMANIPIDQISAASQTKNNYIPVYDTIKAIGKALGKRDSFEAQMLTEYLVLGGEKHTFVGWQDLTPQEFFEKLTGERNGLLKVLDAINKGAEILTLPSQWSEVFTRGTEFIKARKAGKHQWQAMEEAGRVSVPFHHKGRLGGGTLGISLVRSIPYFNPSLQALRYAAERAGSKDGAKRYWAVATAVTTASIWGMYAAVNNASDEQKEQLKNLNPELLANYIYLPAHGGKGLFRIRIPEQIGVIGSLVNMTIMDEMLDAKYTAHEYMAGATSFLPDQVNPTNMAKLFLSFIPQIIKPVIGAITNTKDFPNIRPVEGLGVQNMEPRYRENQGTSQVAKWLGRNDTANKLGLSPIKIDFLLDSYLGRGITQFFGKEIRNPAYQKYYVEGGRMFQRYYEIREEAGLKMNTFKNHRGDFTPDEVAALFVKKAIISPTEKLLKEYRKSSREDMGSEKTIALREEVIRLMDALMQIDKNEKELLGG